jgi:hypothetical protein
MYAIIARMHAIAIRLMILFFDDPLPFFKITAVDRNIIVLMIKNKSNT